ncbi:DMT family transporter [Paenibacillus apiarius]|uniref:DMT family transporter n=1 Tax=Paenibacillus apiarius TaxID=46240 RepID=A0ABT4DN18_9BACL|nr:DMT family transporter [Paenibacillus apiarius]MCY9514739.1 DMT family transporter [Paenibacillus apiarius]MCY9518729.1 DMT family transporter [Paenibacillus apiarius]MCY9552830.1 DMT family transporter [Paenibacillus apiarius]MCY9556855.1 DMT family transporter [Paenibacillus apiarius]MCY9686192.1 DMT family transporter [Paenibacillus apiarius]
MIDSSEKKAYLAAILYAFIIGFSFVFVKLALTAADPMSTLAHRFSVSIAIATIPVAFGWVKLNISPKDIVRILPLALFYPAMFFAFQAFGLVYASSSEAGIIQAAVPIFTMLLASYFLKERSSLGQKLSVALSVAGVIYIFIMNGVAIDASNIKGTVLILLSALASAGYNVMARPMTRKFKLIDITYMMTLVGFLTFNVMSLATHGMNGTVALYFAPFTDLTFIVSILYLGVLSSLVTSFLSNYALSHMEASKMSVFGNLATFITMIAGVLVLDEQLKYYHLIGACMIVLGIAGTAFLGKRHARAH